MEHFTSYTVDRRGIIPKKVSLYFLNIGGERYQLRLL